jgi:hypothetical protein
MPDPILNVTLPSELSFNIFENDFDDLNINPMREADPDLHFFAQTTPSADSKYFTENSFNQVFDSTVRPNQLSILHHNNRGIPHNFADLSLYLSSLSCSFDVIGITETWLEPHNVDSYKLPGYKSESLIRNSRVRGGVSIFLRESLRYHVRQDLCIMNDFMEGVFIEVTSLNRRTIFAVIYRPPGTDLRAFNETFAEILEQIRSESKLCYIMGDFNVDLLKISSHALSAEFCHLLYSNAFLPLITKPTRITPDSATLIDNIFTNSPTPSEHKPGLLYTDISDHLPIFTSVKVQVHQALLGKTRLPLPQRNIAIFPLVT